MFSLKWNKFSDHIVTTLHELRENDDFTDVTLSCDGKYIKAHKILLSVCSSYFKEIFNSNPCKHPVIIFNRVDYNNLQTLITFMYQGEVHISQENLSTFLETAELLQIKGLTDFSGDGGGGEDHHHHHPHHQLDQNINNNTSRHSRSASPQHTYGFSSSPHDLMTASADTTNNPILKSLSNLTSKAVKRARLSQPQPSGSSSLSSFAHMIDAHNSSYASSPSSIIPASQVPLTRPVVLVSKNNINNNNSNKIVRSNGAKTTSQEQASSSSNSRFSTTGNIINNSSNGNGTTMSSATDSLNHVPNIATNLIMTNSNGGDHFSRNTVTIKNEQGEFLYEEEFSMVAGTTRVGEGQVTIDNNQNAAAAMHSSVIVPAPGYIRRSNSTTTTTNTIIPRNESGGPSSVLEEALLGRKRSTSNNFNSKSHNFLKNKDGTKLTSNNVDGPPKLNREVPLLNSTTTSSPSSSTSSSLSSTFPSQSRQSHAPFQSRSNLTSNQNRNGQVSTRAASSPNSDMPLDLEMEKKVEPCDYTTSGGSSSSISKGQSVTRAPPVDNKMDLARQDAFFFASQLNLLRNRQSPPNTRPASVSSSSLTTTTVSSHTQQQQQQQPKSRPPVVSKHNNATGENSNNVESGSSRSFDHSHGIMPSPHYSVSHQLLKSAKATVRAKEKQQQQQQQQGQTGAAASSSSATIKARATKTRNSIGPIGHSPTAPSKIRRVSSYSNVNGSASSIKSRANNRGHQGKSSDVGQDLTSFQSIHNRNDTGVSGPYVCNLCGKRYVHHRSLNDHKKFHTGATRCPACNKSFSKVANLRAHFVNAHKNGNMYVA